MNRTSPKDYEERKKFLKIDNIVMIAVTKTFAVSKTFAVIVLQ